MWCAIDVKFWPSSCMLRLPGRCKGKKRTQFTKINYYTQVMLTLSEAIRPPTPTTSKEKQHPCGLSAPLTSFGCRNTWQVNPPHTQTSSWWGVKVCACLCEAMEREHTRDTEAAEECPISLCWDHSGQENMMLLSSVEYMRCLKSVFILFTIRLNKKKQGSGQNAKSWGKTDRKRKNKVPSSQLRSFFSSSTPSFSNPVKLVSISSSSLSICATGIWYDFTWYKTKDLKVPVE